jgi:hypothetical protein
MDFLNLIDFTSIEESMVKSAMEALEKVGYQVSVFKELIKVEMPPGYRAMTLGSGAALSDEAFESQEWLNHVLEEECLHLIQKAKGWADEFVRGTAFELELDVNDSRKFPPPEG